MGDANPEARTRLHTDFPGAAVMTLKGDIQYMHPLLTIETITRHGSYIVTAGSRQRDFDRRQT